MAYLKAIVMTLGAYISRSFVDCNLFKWDALLLLTAELLVSVVFAGETLL